jgi:hypothetical protein
MSSCNDTASGLVLKSEKFSYIEAKGADIQELCAASTVAASSCWSVSPLGTAADPDPTLPILTSGQRSIIMNTGDTTGPVVAITLSNADLDKTGRVISIFADNGGQDFDVVTEDPNDYLNSVQGGPLNFSGGTAFTVVSVPSTFGGGQRSANQWYVVPN